MLFYFGTRAKQLKSAEIRNVICPHCQKDTTMTIDTYGKYAHLWFIPFFPVKKLSLATCHICNDNYHLRELPEKIKDRIAMEKEKYSARIPVWMFSGLILVAGLILFSVYNFKQDEINEQAYIKDPKPGDVFYMQLDSGSHYFSMRVDKIDKDSIYTTVNDYETNRKGDVAAIDKSENYTNSKYAFSRLEALSLFGQEKIFSVRR